MSESVPRLLLDAYQARKQGATAIERWQRARLFAIVAFARAYSPYYRELYQHLPKGLDDPTLLPVTDKKRLMACFDDWVTDREVTAAQVRAFVDNPNLIGERFLGKYLVATTSGTSGIPGIFLLDQLTLAVATTFSIRMMMSWLNAGDLIRILAGRGCTALVQATGGHFIGATGFAAVRNRRLAKPIRLFAAQIPLPDLVTELNRFRPVLLGGYASVMTLLAGEQEAGRLHIKPALVHPSSEGLSQDGYDRISTAFHAKVRTAYAATECLHLAYGCAYGWLHINSDWVVLEPVDADHRPVAPGEQSYTVLVTNLANRVQPILRYDLGDRIMQRPDPCTCGDPLPAIRVQGRAADVLTFPTERGQPVSIPPLALEVDHVPGVELFQVVQSAPTNLRVRLRTAAGADPDRVWQAVHAELKHLLTAHGLDHVAVECAEKLPEQSLGGKYRTVIPLC
jgi:phenylacetate-CoA ligase